MGDMLLELRVEERKNRGGHLGGIFFFFAPDNIVEIYNTPVFFYSAPTTMDSVGHTGRNFCRTKLLAAHQCGCKWSTDSFHGSEGPGSGLPCRSTRKKRTMPFTGERKKCVVILFCM